MFVVDDAIKAVATVATTIASIKDQSKRRMIESNMALMTADEQAQLAQKIAGTNDSNARASILINAVLAARDANENRKQRAQTIMWIVIGVFGLGTLITLAWYLKKKG
jgi:hypothetical protein